MRSGGPGMPQAKKAAPNRASRRDGAETVRGWLISHYGADFRRNVPDNSPWRARFQAQFSARGSQVAIGGKAMMIRINSNTQAMKGIAER